MSHSTAPYPREIKIVNMVASARLKGSIDIETLAEKLPKASYEPEMFPGLVYRRTKPTIIMFASGKISSHGAKSEDEAKHAIVTALKEIRDLGCVIGSTEMEDVKIHNVVGSGDFGRGLSLEDLMNHFGYTRRDALYEPEQFPGLIYRPFNNSVVCLLFSTGKVVIVGGKSESQITEAFREVEDVLKSYFGE